MLTIISFLSVLLGITAASLSARFMSYPKQQPNRNREKLVSKSASEVEAGQHRPI